MKILIAGDYSPVGKTKELINKGKYNDLLYSVKQHVETVDLSIINYESTLANEKDNVIDKLGPGLNNTKKSIDALKWVGFDAVTLANNHFRDYGDPSVSRTLAYLDEIGLMHVGGGNTIKEASKNLYIEKEGQKIAIINACEHEFSIADECHGGSNPLNPIQQFYAIKEARDKADFVIVIAHGGHEHYQLPSPRMQEIYRFWIDVGADVVVNHHQHCYSGYEIYKGKLIFYGLGNLLFDKFSITLPDTWHEGYMVELEVEKSNSKDVSFQIIPYFQCKDEASVKMMDSANRERFFNEIEILNMIVSNPKELKKQHEEWMKKMGDSFKIQFTPWYNRWLEAAYRRHLLPSFLPKNKILTLLNHIECESHLERTIYALKNF